MDILLEIIKENSTLLIKGCLIIAGYLLTFYLTTFLIKKIVFKGKENIDVDNNGKIDFKDKQLIRDGFIIGKCENIIILTFVLAGEVTGLALIFAAKNLARQKAIQDNAGFFLAGTLVNFTTSLLIGYALKICIDYL